MIHFILNKTLVSTSVKTGMSLLHFIREEQGLKGTKSGCKEGDCGACTVLVGTLQDNGSIDYMSVTSCLTPLAKVQGKHIVTIEGLNLETGLNVAQKAIKDHYATQCGFCTPGFVNSLSGVALKHGTISQEDTINAVSGNICRCTGYKSIQKAAKNITEQLEEKPVHENELEWLITHKFIPTYFKEIPNRLTSIQSSEKEESGVLVAGGTDLYVRYADSLLNENIQQAQNLVTNRINVQGDICTIDAGVTVEQIYQNEVLNASLPNLKEYLQLISSEQIRNMASIAGNFVNASPIGDLSIFFLALNSSLRIKSSSGESRLLPLKAFFKDYKKIDLKEEEYIENLSFELPDKATFFNFEKVSKRTHLDIASVNSAVSLKLTNQVIYDIHIAIGGVSAIPLYLTKTSQFLKGKELTITTILEAQAVLQKEIAPISDVRGATAYKRLLARQLFFAHFLKLFPDIFNLKDLVA